MANIMDILARFRLNPIGLLADIEKAFLQISLEESQRDCVRFFWYDDQPHEFFGDNKVIPYRMKRLTFGVNASPFVLNQVIQTQLDSFSNKFPAEVDSMKMSFYMDDLVISVPSPHAAKSLYKSAKEIFSDMKMNLRGWTTNDKCVQEWLTSYGEESMAVENVTKVVGTVWNLEQDCFCFQFKWPSEPVSTKRQFLSAYASIWDPLGVLSPLLATIKFIFQKIWSLNLDWDTQLPSEILNQINQCVSSFQLCETLNLPRFIDVASGEISLHCF